MGQMTDAKIAGWQKWADIDPATGEYREKLEKISQAAFELIKVVELERSGIRDGDGYWYGSDAMCGTMQDIWPSTSGYTGRVNRRRLSATSEPAESCRGMSQTRTTICKRPGACGGRPDQIGDGTMTDIDRSNSLADLAARIRTSMKPARRRSNAALNTLLPLENY